MVIIYNDVKLQYWAMVIIYLGYSEYLVYLIHQELEFNDSSCSFPDAGSLWSFLVTSEIQRFF